MSAVPSRSDSRFQALPTERRAAFFSILFDRPGHEQRGAIEPPTFRDLGLDQVVDAVIARDDEDLRPLFWQTLPDAEAVRYRQAIFLDLEQPGVAAAIGTFAAQLRTARARLVNAEKLEYRQLSNQGFLDAASAYCDATVGLAERLASEPLQSGGLTAFRDYVNAYVNSDEFRTLQIDADECRRARADVRYSLLLRGPRITVRKQDSGADFSADVNATFARFHEGELQDHHVEFRGELSMGHVQEWVLERVARLYPAEFASLQAFRTRHAGFSDATLIEFARDVRFYVAVLDHVDRLKAAGLPFCYPTLADRSSATRVTDVFDLALADKCIAGGRSIVRNDVELRDAERVIVVTGPNQGGKTTFARMVGQIHYLAGLGVPIPARHAKLTLPDHVFTHFEREEQAANLRGKLEDELVRVREILVNATDRSVIIMNESFSSTTLDDSRLLGRRVLDQIVARGALCVYVTFVDDLASPRPSVVSMVAGVDPDDPSNRTFQVLRAPASGHAYAEAIARKYGLSPAQLRERMRR